MIQPEFRAKNIQIAREKLNVLKMNQEERHAAESQPALDPGDICQMTPQEDGGIAITCSLVDDEDTLTAHATTASDA